MGKNDVKQGKIDERLSGVTVSDKDFEIIIGHVEEAQRGVWNGSKKFDEAQKTLDDLAKSYKKFNELMSVQQLSREDIGDKIEQLRKLKQQAKGKIEAYLERKKEQGKLQPAATTDQKTQKRIDVMLDAMKLLENMMYVLDDKELLMDAQWASKTTQKMNLTDDEATDSYKEEIEEQIQKNNGYRMYSAQGAKEGIEQLEDVIAKKTEPQFTPDDIELVRRAMAKVIHNDIINEPDNLNIQFPDNYMAYDKNIKDLSHSPAFTMATKDITIEKLKDFLGDPKVLKKRVIENLKNGGKVISAEEKKDRAMDNMIAGFKADMEYCKKALEETYGKGKSDKSPSGLMERVLKGIADISKGIKEQDSLEDNITQLIKSVDDYTSKRSKPKNEYRVKRLEHMKDLKEKLISYRREIKDIKNGKPGKIHELHLGESTRGNQISQMDLEKNLLSFTYEMMESRNSGMMALLEYDPEWYETCGRPEFLENPPTRIPDELKPVADAMKEFYALGVKDKDGNKPVVSFDIIKEKVEKINVVTSIYLSKHGSEKTNMDKFVRATWENAQEELENIRLLQSYMDVEVQNKRIGSINVYDMVKDMEEPYNQLDIITEEAKIDGYGEKALESWTKVKKLVSKDKNLEQNRIHKAIKFRRDLKDSLNRGRNKAEYNRAIEKNADEKTIKSRKDSFAYSVAAETLIKKLDDEGGWIDFSAEHDKSFSVIKYIRDVQAPRIMESQAFGNVFEKATIGNIYQKVMEEVNRLNKTKEISEILDPNKVTAEVKQLQKN